jgi:hypothetical protein
MEWHVRGQRNPLKAGGNLLRLANFSQIFFHSRKAGAGKPSGYTERDSKQLFSAEPHLTEVEFVHGYDFQMRQSGLFQIADENGRWTLFRLSHVSQENRAFLALPALFQTLHSQAQGRHGGTDQPRPAQGRLVRSWRKIKECPSVLWWKPPGIRCCSRKS